MQPRINTDMQATDKHRIARIFRPRKNTDLFEDSRLRRRSGARPYLALAVLPNGTQDILAIWIEQTEGAKFWMTVFTDLKVRGCQDILIAVTDGLKGMPEALGAIYPATTLQTCSSI